MGIDSLMKKAVMGLDTLGGKRIAHMASQAPGRSRTALLSAAPKGARMSTPKSVAFSGVNAGTGASRLASTSPPPIQMPKPSKPMTKIQMPKPSMVQQAASGPMKLHNMIHSSMPSHAGAFGMAVGAGLIGAGVGGYLLGGGMGGAVGGAIGGTVLGGAMAFGGPAAFKGALKMATSDSGASKHISTYSNDLTALGHGLQSSQGRAYLFASGGLLGGAAFGGRRNSRRGFNQNRGSSIGR